MTPRERAYELVKRDGCDDYYYEGWARQEGIEEAIAAAVAEEREACAVLGDERSKEFRRKRAAMSDVTHIETSEGAWYRAREVEADDYAASIRAQP